MPGRRLTLSAFVKFLVIALAEKGTRRCWIWMIFVLTGLRRSAPRGCRGREGGSLWVPLGQRWGWAGISARGAVP